MPNYALCSFETTNLLFLLPMPSLAMSLGKPISIPESVSNATAIGGVKKLLTISKTLEWIAD